MSRQKNNKLETPKDILGLYDLPDWEVDLPDWEVDLLDWDFEPPDWVVGCLDDIL